MFYKTLADYYDFIFPQTPKQLDFIEQISPITPNDEIIDIGCATGNLTKLLHDKSKRTTGLDLDENLLKVAKGKYKHIHFDHLNMMDIDVAFPNNSTDKIISFGNTLVHLKNRRHVKSFFKRSYSVLKEGGYLIIQIINYDRIINQNITSLPTIENKDVTFIRNYKLIEDNSKVEFNTSLTTKDGFKAGNTIELLSLRKTEIEEYLEEAKFRDIRFYGNLDGNEVTEDSIPLLFSCRK